MAYFESGVLQGLAATIWSCSRTRLFRGRPQAAMERKAARQAGRGAARAWQGHLPTCAPFIKEPCGTLHRLQAPFVQQ